MQTLFPAYPFFPADRQGRQSVQEWVAPTLPRRALNGICRMLPAGKPDCLHIETLRREDGIERCTAAVYGKHAYLIHYEFTPHLHAPK